MLRRVISQVVVEKKLMREEQKTRHEIGRERFVSQVSLNCKSGLYKLLKLYFFSPIFLFGGLFDQKVWDWKNKYGGTILQQLRRLGASLDWTREVKI